MKTIKLISISLLLLADSCSIINNKNNLKISKMNVPDISNSMEKFEIKNFEPLNNGVRVDNSDSVFFQGTPNTYIEKKANGDILKNYYKPIGNSGEISGFDYSLDPIIGIYKEFFANGNIKLKGLCCYYGFKIGLWYSFDETGQLIDTVNYDVGYNFGTDRVIDYCREKGINLTKIHEGNRLNIYKKKLEQKSIWLIKYPDFENRNDIIIRLDGDTGDLLSRRESPFPAE